MRFTRWRRMSTANSGPRRFYHRPTVSWPMSIPCPNSESSTLRPESGNRASIITTSRITSGDALK